MQSYFLRNLSELAEKRAINVREEAQLWDILARDLKREAGRREEEVSKKIPPKIEFDPISKASNPLEGKLYVRILEAAKIMGISRSSIYLEMNSGRLKAKKNGHRTLIAVSEIENWAEKLKDK